MKLKTMKVRAKSGIVMPTVGFAIVGGAREFNAENVVEAYVNSALTRALKRGDLEVASPPPATAKKPKAEKGGK